MCIKLLSITKFQVHKFENIDDFNRYPRPCRVELDATAGGSRFVKKRRYGVIVACNEDGNKELRWHFTK